MKDKLFNYKQTPSTDVWERISASLDSDIQFPGKLYNFQTTPPPHIWSSINENLDNVQRPHKFGYLHAPSKILKYLAAAAILFAVVFSATQLLSRRSAKTQVSIISKPVEQKPPIIIIDKNTVPVVAYQPTKKRATTKIHERKHSFKSFFFSAPKLREIAPVEDNHLAIETPSVTPVTAAINNHPDLSLADRFMVYTDDDGNHMRLPKKLFSLVHCNTDDYSCKQNLQNLQQKILSASVSADFGGFLDMLKQLQENH